MLKKWIYPKTVKSTVSHLNPNEMLVEFWGCRGTLCVPGKETLRYGGNTNCVTLRVGKKHYFIFDAGTGLKALSNHIVQNNISPFSAKIFISHPHWDHINGLPFFVPFYTKGYQFDIYSISQGDMDVEKMLFHQMDSIYFPVTNKEFLAKLSFYDLGEENFYIDDINIQSIQLSHPGRCLGFRIEYHGKVFCYVTDNELYLKDSSRYDPIQFEKMCQFIFEADLVVMDTTYTDKEYRKKLNWGHSCLSQVIHIAHQTQVKLLCLFHHDPGQTDRHIDQKLKNAKDLLEACHSKTRCIAPHERQQILI